MAKLHRASMVKIYPSYKCKRKESWKNNLANNEQFLKATTADDIENNNVFIIDDSIDENNESVSIANNENKVNYYDELDLDNVIEMENFTEDNLKDSVDDLVLANKDANDEDTSETNIQNNDYILVENETSDKHSLTSHDGFQTAFGGNECDYDNPLITNELSLDSKSYSTMKDKCFVGNDKDNFGTTSERNITGDENIYKNGSSDEVVVAYQMPKLQPDGEYKCDKCEATFVYSLYYHYHLNNSKCSMTKYKTMGRGQQPRDESKETFNRSFSCTHCPYKAFSYSNLVVHTRKHTNERPYQCSVCAASFSTSFNLKRHLRSHTNDRPFKCTICKAGFKTSGNLTVHVRIHTNEKPYKCTVCPASFAQISNLDRHIRTHTNEKPYECTYCPRKFISSSDLKRHIRTHTKEKPYKCFHCSAGFATSGNLTVHMRRHTKEKPFKCTVCLTCFADSSNLKTHMRTHTNDRPFKCAFCTSSYTQISNLRIHVLKQHVTCNCFKCNPDNVGGKERKFNKCVFVYREDINKRSFLDDVMMQIKCNKV